MSNASFYIEHLNLVPHPEGGYYKETYRSVSEIETGSSAIRNTATSIYFLLQNEEKSHLHRIKSDEQWYYHDGNVLEILVLYKGVLTIQLLGKDLQSLVWFTRAT
jgi:predicted cupin superfamily sugar epimerase